MHHRPAQLRVLIVLASVHCPLVRGASFEPPGSPAFGRAGPRSRLVLAYIPMSSERGAQRTRTWSGGVARSFEELALDAWLEQTAAQRVNLVWSLVEDSLNLRGQKWAYASTFTIDWRSSSAPRLGSYCSGVMPWGTTPGLGRQGFAPDQRNDRAFSFVPSSRATAPSTKVTNACQRGGTRPAQNPSPKPVRR